jgi:hypothetical protein
MIHALERKDLATAPHNLATLRALDAEIYGAGGPIAA